MGVGVLSLILYFGIFVVLYLCKMKDCWSNHGNNQASICLPLITVDWFASKVIFGVWCPVERMLAVVHNQPQTKVSVFPLTFRRCCCDAAGANRVSEVI